MTTVTRTYSKLGQMIETSGDWDVKTVEFDVTEIQRRHDEVYQGVERRRAADVDTRDEGVLWGSDDVTTEFKVNDQGQWERVK